MTAETSAVVMDPGAQVARGSWCQDSPQGGLALGARAMGVLSLEVPPALFTGAWSPAV